MKKLFILLIPVLIGLTACGNKLTVEQAEAAVLQGENEKLPLLIQKMADVESIVIDSIHIRIVDEPMSGYLYTTWQYAVKRTIRPTVEEMMRGIYESKHIDEHREKQVIVEVDNIRQSVEHKGYIEWETNWPEAYRIILSDIY